MSLTYWKSTSPEVEDRLIELAASGDGYPSQQALEALSRAPQKSERIVDVLISVLSRPDYNARRPAYQGLKTGIPGTEQRSVADAVLETIERVGSLNDHICCFQILNVCADASHLPTIRRFLDNPMLPPASRKHLSRYLVRIEKRLERE